MPKQRATITDVAEAAGVGRATVSRVLNESPKVSPDVRKRVLETIKSLRYKPNPQARLLAGGRTHALLLVFPAHDVHPLTWYFMLLESGLLRGAAQYGLQLTTHFVFPHSESRTHRILSQIEAGACDGVILAPPFCDDVVLLEEVKARKMPFALIAAGRQTRGIAPGIGMDDEEAGRELAEYLLKLGHRRFAFVLGLEDHISAGERYEGFRKEAAKAGIGAADIMTVKGSLNFVAGISAMEDIIASGFSPSAIVCANDEMAAGALHVSHQRAIRIPQDVTIVGFDDAPFASILSPPLTTIAQPIYAMAQKVVDILMESIKGVPLPYELAHPRLVKRESSAPPKLPSVSPT